MEKLLRRCFIILFFIFSMLFLFWQTLPQILTLLTNQVLPSGTVITFTGTPLWQDKSLILPDVRITFRGCELLDATTPRISFHQQRWLFQLNRVETNSQCMSGFFVTRPGAASPFSLADWLVNLPNSQIMIAQLIVAPWQDYAGELSLYADKGEINAHYTGLNLSFAGTLNSKGVLNLQTLLLKAHSMNRYMQLSGIVYVPTPFQPLQTRGALRGELRFPNTSRGLVVSLDWEQRQGILTIKESEREQFYAYLPWNIDNKQIHVEKGKWHWSHVQQPVGGSVNLTLLNWREAGTKAILLARINMLTQSKNGKANAVMTLDPVKIGQITRGIDFQLNGQANFTNTSIGGTLPGRVVFLLNDPSVTFKPGAILRVYNHILSPLKTNAVHIPLAGINISRRGVNGQLHAILRTSNSPLGEMQIHLSGNAKNFRPDHTDLQWKFWGNGRLPGQNADLTFSGKGRWNQGAIVINKLTAYLKKFHNDQIIVESLKMMLVSPVKIWNSSKITTLSGSVALRAKKIHLSTGGSMSTPELRLQFQGPSINNITLNGVLLTDHIGPAQLYGHWNGERLRGSGWLSKQPITAFQSLVPAEVKTTLHNGYLSAQSAFSFSGKEGLQMRGHFVTSNAEIWYNDVKIWIKDSIASYRFHNKRWQLGVEHPVSLQLKLISNFFNIHSVTAKIQGFYPYTNNYPFILSTLRIELMGGSIELNELKLPSQQAAVITVNEININNLLHTMKVKKFTMSGYVNGELPLFLNDPQWLIKEGWLENKGEMTLYIDSDIIREIKKRDTEAGIAVNLLNHLEIKQSRMNINLDNFGNLIMRSNTHGINSDIDSKRDIMINHQHQQNIFKFARSLQFSDKIKERIEQKLSSPEGVDK